MFLLIDQGNSRCKYLLTKSLSGISVAASGVGSWDNDAFNDDIWRQHLVDLKSHGITDVLVSSVASEDRKSWFKALCETVLGLTPRFAVSKPNYISATHRKNLINSYQTPEALGVDRWLAMIAVFERVKGSFVVVDAGTAITSDWIDAAGHHKGGHIVAGDRLLQQTLMGNTGGIAWSAGHDKDARAKEGHDHGAVFGENTSKAVSFGAEAMVKGYCYQLVTLISEGVMIEGNNGSLPVFVVTGGNGELISQWIRQAAANLELDYEIQNHPHLVLEGISHWFSLNN